VFWAPVGVVSIAFGLRDGLYPTQRTHFTHAFFGHQSFNVKKQVTHLPPKKTSQKVCCKVFSLELWKVIFYQGMFLQFFELFAVGWFQNLPREVRPYWHRARNQIRPDRSGGAKSH